MQQLYTLKRLRFIYFDYTRLMESASVETKRKYMTVSHMNVDMLYSCRDWSRVNRLNVITEGSFFLKKYQTLQIKI